MDAQVNADDIKKKTKNIFFSLASVKPFYLKEMQSAEPFFFLVFFVNPYRN